MENQPPTTDEIQEQDEAPPEPAGKRPSTLPLTLTLVSLLVWFGFQTAQLVVERHNLRMVKANLETAMQESQKMRAQLQTLIAKTAELASQGNANAKTAVQELEKRGIPISAGPGPSK